MIAVLAGLGAAVAWAASTLCSSRSSRMLGAMPVVGWIALIGLLVTAPVAAAEGVPGNLDAANWAWLALSGAGNIGGLLLAYVALRTGAVSLVAPLVATEGAIAAVIAVAAGESVSPGTGFALAVVALGTCVAASTRGPEGAPASARVAAFAIAAALSFGVSLYATARAGNDLPTAWVVLSARVVGTLAVALPLALGGRLHLTRRAAPLVVTSALCEVLGFVFYTAGARHNIAVAAVLSTQFAAISVLVGYLLFGERLARLQLAGVATVIVGVTAVSLLST